MRRTVGPGIGVKASGGVRTIGDGVLAMLAAGADRIGTSATSAMAACARAEAPPLETLHPDRSGWLGVPSAVNGPAYALAGR